MNETQNKVEGLISCAINAPRRRTLQNFQKQIGITFKRIELLNLALTHSSYSRYYDKVFDDNEKLEYMGDAVLELASSTFIFKKFHTLEEGELTKLRASVVCQSTLSKIAMKLGLGKIMLFDPGEESSGGAERESNLEDAFEALIGAIYLDCGWETARQFVYTQLAPEFENLNDSNIRDELQQIVLKNLSDYKSRLQEVIKQHNPESTVEYVEISASGPSHMPTFEHAVKIDGQIMGNGLGKTKKIAEQAAAKMALENLDAEWFIKRITDKDEVKHCNKNK